MAVNAGSMYANFGLQMKGLAQSQQAFMNVMKNMSKQVEEVKQKLNTLEGQAKQTGQAMSNSMSTVAPALKTVEKSFQQTGAAIFQSAQRWRTFGYLTSIVLTAPMVLAGKQALDTAKDFDYSMAKIVGLVGLGKQEVAGFRKEILKMGPALAQTPQALADALYYVTSAGFKNGAEALKIVEIAAKGATAGLGQTEDVAKLLVFSMNAYRKSGLTAERTADIFTAAVREGAIEAEGFASSMQSVLPIASALGVRIEEVAGTMAAMSLQGASAQNAAVYLKGVMNALLKLKPGSGGGKELEAMGVKVDDLIAKLREPGGLMKVLIQLKELSKDVGGVPFLKNVFRDIRAMTGDLSLMGDNFEYNEQVIKAVTEAGGDLSRAFLAQSDEMKKRLDTLKSTMDTIKISFGGALGKVIIPMMEKWIKVLSGIVNVFDNMSDGTKKAIIHILGLVAAIGPLTLLVSVLKYMYGGFFMTFIKQAKFAGQAIKWLSGDMLAFGRAMEYNKKATGWIAKLMTAKAAAGGWGLLAKSAGKAALSFGRMAGPVGLVVGTLGFGVVKFIKYVKQTKEAAKQNDAFYKTMVTVNGELKKFNEMATEDIQDMTFLEMTRNQEKARQVWEAAYNTYNNLQNLKNTTSGNDRQLTKMMEDQNKHIETAKQMYEALTTAIQKYTKEEMAAARDVLNEKLKEETEQAGELKKKIQEVVDTMNKKLKSVEARAEIKAFNNEPFDIIEEKVKVIQEALERLSDEEIQLTINDREVARIAVMLQKLGYDFTGITKKANDFANEFNADMAKVDMKRLILGPTFDANTAKLEITQKALEGYIDTLLSPINADGLILEPTPEQLAKIKEMGISLERYKQIQQKLVDRESIALLKAEANAFGNIAGKVEVLNYELQASERYLKDLLKKRYSTGFVDEEAIKRTVRRIQDVKLALVDLQNQQDVTYLKDMNKRFLDLNSSTDELEGHISALESKLRLLSELGKGNTVQFKMLYDQMKHFKNIQNIAERLGDSLADVFDVLIDGGDETKTTWQNIAIAVEDMVKDLIKDIARLVIKTLVLKGLMATLKFGNDDIAKSMEESIAAGMQSLTEGLKLTNKLMPTNNPLANAPGKVTGLMPGVGTGIGDPDKLIPDTGLIDKATSKLTDLTKTTKKYGKVVEATSVMEDVGNKALEASNLSKQSSVITTGTLAAAEKASATATEAATTAKVAAIPIEKAVTTAEAAAIPVTEAKASADIKGAGASAVKGAAKLPWPLAILAIGLAVGAVSAGVASIIKASKMKKGGIVPDGFPNDSFPAMLTSGEIVLPEEKLRKMFGRDTDIVDTIKRNVSVVPRLAEGGIIPPGFPNDSYPAMLSSNEAVIPLERIERKGMFDEANGEVVFHIGQDELYGILKKKTKRTTIY